jgi:hypothetical protein
VRPKIANAFPNLPRRWGQCCKPKGVKVRSRDTIEREDDAFEKIDPTPSLLSLTPKGMPDRQSSRQINMGQTNYLAKAIPQTSTSFPSNNFIADAMAFKSVSQSSA